jgi:hypothetical protein
MTTNSQMRFDLKTQEGRQRCKEFLMQCFSPEFKRYLERLYTEQETETDPMTGSVQGKFDAPNLPFNQ